MKVGNDHLKVGMPYLLCGISPSDPDAFGVAASIQNAASQHNLDREREKKKSNSEKYGSFKMQKNHAHSKRPSDKLRVSVPSPASSAAPTAVSARTNKFINNISR